ncbi:MAG: outer membrane beta-barrel protein [Hyphomicrobiales bacterium]
MPRRPAVLTLALSLALTLLAADAGAASIASGDAHPASRRPPAERGEGLYGRTLLSAHIGFSAPTGHFGDVYDSGPGFGGSIGYGVSRNVVLSLGLAYHHFDNQATSTLNASITPFTMDAVVALPSSSKVKPWIGGGMGMYHVKESLDLVSGGILTRDSISENNFGMNIGAGLMGRVSPRAMFGGGVKYHQVWGNEFIDTPFMTVQLGMAWLL